MKKKSTLKIISTLIIIFSAIGILTMFAAAFDEDVGTVRGNVFQVMFGMGGVVTESDYYQVVWPLVIGFIAIGLALLLAFSGYVLPEKDSKVLYITEIILTLGCGVLFLMLPYFYIAANPQVENLNLTGTTSLGPGSICVAVFSFICTALGLIGLYLSNKKD